MTGVLTALLCAVLGLMMACGAGGESPPPEMAKAISQENAVEPEVSYEVAFEAISDAEMEQKEPDVELRRFHTVKTVTVKRGEGIRFIAKNLSAWILIPDGGLVRGSGGTDWVVTASYIAFRIDKGNATVVVPTDYPRSEVPTEIYFSVLVQEDTHWDYIHGDSPPRMIIPP